MNTIIPPLGQTSLLCLLLQLIILLVVARGLAELMKRIGQPPVIGELMAGILLGPSLLGALSPKLFQTIFPPDITQYHLLEILSWIGMILLLLMTGLETDIKLIKNLGRPAFSVSLFGMAIPFLFGFLLGWWTPDELLIHPGTRVIFSIFLATAMAISALPVIARILLDLNLMKRNLGIIILSASVVDDTMGWLILSIIAGIAKGENVRASSVLLSSCATGVFIMLCYYILRPALKSLTKAVDTRATLDHSDLTVILLLTLLCAATTEAIGIHAAFGAFIAGLLIRQTPRIRRRTLEVIESMAVGFFAPLFFAYVGLRVDLFHLHHPSMLIAVIFVAILGKTIGCTAGSLLGKFSFREAISIGIGMNARGAMGLVVAMIGLSLGIVTQEFYSMIVVMAMVTSLMAPPLLRWILSGISLTDEERSRIEADTSKVIFDKTRLKILIPTAGGTNAMKAIQLALPLGRHGGVTTTVLYVGEGQKKGRGLFQKGRGGWNIQHHFDEIEQIATQQRAEVTLRRIGGTEDVIGAIQHEARRGYDLIFLGASGGRHIIYDDFLEQIIGKTPCHTIIMKNKDLTPKDVYQRILVPTEGGYFSRVALEFAIIYAEEVGASITLLHVMETQLAGFPFALPQNGRFSQEREATLFKGMTPLLSRTTVEVEMKIAEGTYVNNAIVQETLTGFYDLLVIGAENRALREHLFFGYGTEHIVTESACSVAVVIPQI